MMCEDRQQVVTPTAMGVRQSLRYEVERCDASGVTEKVFTTFDHACIAMWCHGAQQNDARLFAATKTLCEAALFGSDGPRWHFSSAVPDIPPDIDSTSAALRCILLARGSGWRDAPSIPVLLAPIFRGCVTGDGDLLTYIEPRHNNVVDPVANLRVANLLIDNGERDSLLLAVIRRIDQLVRMHGWDGIRSRFYIGPWALIEQAAEAISRLPEAWSRAAVDSFDRFLETARPTGAIAAAMLSYAALLRDQRAAALRFAQLLRDGEAYGVWGFEPYYIQRTPRYDYGCATLTRSVASRSLAELMRRSGA